MEWSLYKKGELQKPLVFSNGKSQEDIVEEVLQAVKEGYKIILIKGICGTGKSAIALHIAKELGQTSIVVPIKNLQKQYEEDYSDNYYILKENGQKMKITVLTGRQNHLCPYRNNDCACDDEFLPCMIEINEKNREKIRDYLKNSPLFSVNQFKTVGDVKRKNIAVCCDYWSPVIREKFLKEKGEEFIPDVREKIKYAGLNGNSFIIHLRKDGCGYYNQFLSFKDADVLVFNSKKYVIETLLERKPHTEVEIIDECDYFLDNLGNEKSINLNFLSSKLSKIILDLEKSHIREQRDKAEKMKKIEYIIAQILDDKDTEKYIHNREIIELEKTKLLLLLKSILKTPEIAEFEDLENYFETAVDFEGFLDDSYALFRKNDHNQIVADIVTVSLEKKMKEFIDKNKVFVMMSGTLHSPEVLKDIFGIEKLKIIEAETEQQGQIIRKYTGFERNFRYREFSEGRVSREQYLKALSKCIETAKRPILIHVNSFFDLPSAQECENFSLDNIQTREKLKELQKKYGQGQLIRKFKDGEIDIIYSTVCNRGIDFPGEMCNSIILTKYPFPDIDSLFMKILKKNKPGAYNEFYVDKARREFVQRVYRGLRSKNDKIYLLSPDLKVMNNNHFKYGNVYSIDKKGI